MASSIRSFNTSNKLFSIHTLLVRLKLQTPKKGTKTSDSRPISTATTKSVAVSDMSAKAPEQTSAASLVALAEKALELAKKLESSVSEAPSFEKDTLVNLTTEAEAVKLQLIDVSKDLHDLTRGPSGPFGRIQGVACVHFAEQMSLHFIYRFKIHKAVPLTGDISFTELAQKVNVDEATLVRLLRYAMTHHMFKEPRKGFVAHTLDSRLLVEDTSLYDFVGCCLEDLRPAAVNHIDAIQKWNGSQEPNQVGFNLAFDTELPCYRYLAQFPDRIRRVSEMMVQVSKSGSGVRDAKRVGSVYPWATLGKSKIIDVGGGNGHVSIALAREHPDLQFIIQDLPHVCAGGQASLPEEMRERVSFMPHDVFKTNPVTDASAFFLMNMIHTWSDKYTVQIFRNLLPSMKPGSRILVCDRVIPDRGTISEVAYKEILSTDMYMMANVNGRERSIEDIQGLFKEADERLAKKTTVHQLPGSLFAICEAVWEP